jgi:hypothetical protein
MLAFGFIAGEETAEVADALSSKEEKKKKKKKKKRKAKNTVTQSENAQKNWRRTSLLFGAIVRLGGGTLSRPSPEDLETPGTPPGTSAHVSLTAE